MPAASVVGSPPLAQSLVLHPVSLVEGATLGQRVMRYLDQPSSGRVALAGSFTTRLAESVVTSFASTVGALHVRHAG